MIGQEGSLIFYREEVRIGINKRKKENKIGLRG